MHPPILYQIALTLIPGIGPVRAKSLLSYCGSAESIFKEKKTILTKIPEIGAQTAGLFTNKEIFNRAEREIKFIENNGILPIFFTDMHFPDRLKDCEDTPILLYTKGKMDLNAPRIISIVGTRTATSYGKQFCAELISGIRQYSPIVVSGLAYGIDICAHRNALTNGLSTVACVAHGLDKIYPALHSSVAVEMMKNGGLVSEFPSVTRMTPELFPMRNRIIAGLADCTIVLETDEKGGSMITAHLANSYGREVFALPGRYNDNHSSGCNLLIKKNLGAIITSPADLADYMNWNRQAIQDSKQLQIFQDLTTIEASIVTEIKKSGKVMIDELSISTGIGFSELSSHLLSLEFKGVIRSQPGKVYEIFE
jgi:DNA processing protein